MGSGTGFQKRQDGNVHHSASGRALPLALPWRHPSLAGMACRNLGIPERVWTGLSFSRCSRLPMPLGVDPLDPSSPLSLAHHTRGALCWRIHKPPVMPC